MRKTKIVATLGPATESAEMLEKLISAGVDIFRLNMSHAKHDGVRAVVPAIRELSKKLNRPVGILLDTQGPAIRTGDLPNALNLKVGDTFTFTVRGHKNEEIHSVDTNYDGLINDVNVDGVVLVDNGVIRMLVKEKHQHAFKCEVLTEGTMASRRHINLPGIKVNLPALTQKDIEDVHLGLEVGADFIALSFVREAADIQLLRQTIAAKQKQFIPIIAKIEDVQAVQNIDEIIAVADGVMVARGDLGIECPYEELPIIQRKIVKHCLIAGKPVIVATHLLESMIQNPIPTRAEITDVSNAVFESVDALMLSGETTVGRYPAQCVEVLDRVARRIEHSGNFGAQKDLEIHSEKQAMVSSAVYMADKIKANGICVFTRHGNIPAMCAAQRPRHSPIYAFTSDERLLHQMTLRYGVQAFLLPFGDNPEDNIIAVQNLLKQKNLVASGAKLVFISDVLTWGDPVTSVQLRIV
ncbi:MAG: pyruvate kinase [Verrucomicrobiota bacterium]